MVPDPNHLIAVALFTSKSLESVKQTGRSTSGNNIIYSWKHEQLTNGQKVGGSCKQPLFEGGEGGTVWSGKRQKASQASAIQMLCIVILTVGDVWRMLALYTAILRKVTPCAPVAALSIHAFHWLHCDCNPHKAEGSFRFSHRGSDPV